MMQDIDRNAGGNGVHGRGGKGYCGELGMVTLNEISKVGKVPGCIKVDCVTISQLCHHAM